MDVLSIMLSGFVGLLTLVVLYVLHMSKDYGVFKKMGVKYLTPWPVVGNFGAIGKIGYMEFLKTNYNKFHKEKVYGYFEGGKPVLVIRDLDMLREIMVKNFNSFVNRRSFKPEEPIRHAMTALEDDHWRHVRNVVSPTFTSGKLKKMCLLVEETAKSLTSNLRKTCQEDKEIDLKHVFGCYTMDVIANTGFGVSIDSLNDESCPFVKEAKNIMNFGDSKFAVLLLFPVIFQILIKFGVTIFPKESVKFFTSFLDAALETRKSGDPANQKRHDFVQLIAAEESKQNETSGAENKTVTGDDSRERKGLTRLDSQGQAFIFILAGYDTVSAALSFTCFLLAHKPDITTKIQEELDEVLAGKPPTYDNVNSLVYLDMCLNEGLRMYPPGFIVDRTCTQECEVDGINIPKGMQVNFPFLAIYNNPELFPNPEEFDPERFTPENKASRHPYAFLPFGQAGTDSNLTENATDFIELTDVKSPSKCGMCTVPLCDHHRVGPRNCIGMRLALMEMKIALASVLQEMTPVPCSKSVYPPRLNKFQMKAEDGLWVKFVARKHESNQ